MALGVSSQLTRIVAVVTAAIAIACPSLLEAAPRQASGSAKRPAAPAARSTAKKPSYSASASRARRARLARARAAALAREARDVQTPRFRIDEAGQALCMALAQQAHGPCFGGFCLPGGVDENGNPVGAMCVEYENWGASCGPGVPPCIADICGCGSDGCSIRCTQVAVNDGASCNAGGPCAEGGICSDGVCVGDPAPLCKSGRIKDGPCDCDGACCAEGNNCVGKPGARRCQ